MKYCLHIPVVMSLFFLSSIFNSVTGSQNFGELIHYPPDHGVEGCPLEITAKFAFHTSRPERVLTYFRRQGDTQYEYVEMDLQADTYSGLISAEKVIAPEVEYFIVAVFGNNKMVTSPAVNPMSEPYTVPVIEDSKSQDSAEKASEMLIKSTTGAIVKITILSPEPGSEAQKQDVVIAISFIEQKGHLNLNKIRLYLDNKNVTAKAEKSPFLITYVPNKISPGNHSIKIFFIDSKHSNH